MDLIKYVVGICDFTFSITAQKRVELLEKRKRINRLRSFIRYITDYCGASSSPDHRVQTLIKFRKVCSALMATSWLLRIVLLLSTLWVVVDKFDFAPVQSPDMRSSRCKKILVSGRRPPKVERQIFMLGSKGQFWVSKIKKLRQKSVCCLHFF